MHFFVYIQSAIQDVDYENETDLLYVVVTLPDRETDSDMQCNIYFINEKDGSVLKTVPIPTWEPVSCTWLCVVSGRHAHVVSGRHDHTHVVSGRH